MLSKPRYFWRKKKKKDQEWPWIQALNVKVLIDSKLKKKNLFCPQIPSKWSWTAMLALEQFRARWSSLSCNCTQQPWSFPFQKPTPRPSGRGKTKSLAGSGNNSSILGFLAVMKCNLEY